MVFRRIFITIKSHCDGFGIVIVLWIHNGRSCRLWLWSQRFLQKLLVIVIVMLTMPMCTRKIDSSHMAITSKQMSIPVKGLSIPIQNGWFQWKDHHIWSKKVDSSERNINSDPEMSIPVKRPSIPFQKSIPVKRPSIPAQSRFQWKGHQFQSKSRFQWKGHCF